MMVGTPTMTDEKNRAPAETGALRVEASHIFHAALERKVRRDGTPVTGTEDETISHNWSGYWRVNYTEQPYISVSGSWTVPNVSYVKYVGGTGEERSSVWVGIGGDSLGDPLIQLGTEQAFTASGSAPSYYAWYELLPATETKLPTDQYPVNAGDIISASVQCDSACTPGNPQTTWTLTMNNETHPSGGWPFVQKFIYASKLDSAEWIMEATCLSNCSTADPKISSDPDFDQVTFRNATVNGQNPNLSIWNGIIMENPNGGISTPSAPVDGDQFTISFTGIIEYPIPTAASSPGGIAAGPDGALWFTESTGNKIGRIDVAGAISEFSIPTPNSRPVEIALGPDGALWFVEESGNKVGRITTTGSVIEFSIPTAASLLHGIATGPDGALWFTESGGNQIGRITTAGTVTEYPISTPNSNPWIITKGPDGALWFTEFVGNNIGRITTDGSISEYPLAKIYSSPYGITTGPDGALWFTETVEPAAVSGRVGRISTAGAITEFPIPIPPNSVDNAAHPAAITSGPGGILWFTDPREGPTDLFGTVDQLTTTGVVTEFTTLTANSGPSAIVAGPDGAIWFAEQYKNVIGRLYSHFSGAKATRN
jgi:virginiamycin B lyase